MHSAWTNRGIIYHPCNSHPSTLSPTAAETVFNQPVGISAVNIISKDHNCMVDVGRVAVSSIINASGIVHEVVRVGVDLNNHRSIGNR